jgi:peroxiredoxin
MTVGKQIRVSPLQYGKLAPAYELEATDGQMYTRSQFRGKSGLLLLFVQNTPEALVLLNAIAADRDEYAELNTRILVIGLDSAKNLAELANALPFTVLADPNGKAWNAYSGIHDPAYGVFVLDLYGGADAQKIADAVSDLPDAATILQWVKAAQFKCSI